MKHLAAIVAGCALSGCGAVLVQDDWQDRPTHAPLQAHHVELSAKDIARVCAEPSGVHIYGCAMRVVEARVCIIYTPPNPAAWLVEHERKHCAGWDHSPLPGQHGTHVAAAAPIIPATDR